MKEEISSSVFRKHLLDKEEYYGISWIHWWSSDWHHAGSAMFRSHGSFR